MLSKKSVKKVSISKKEEIDNNEESNKSDEEYNKSVKKFFEMKKKWEKNINKKKQMKCLICNNITNNMIFEITYDLYLAKCDKKTCHPFEISRRHYILLQDKIKEISDKINFLKNKFIVEKMDTMFKFIDNKNAIKTFKNEYEEYRELIKEYNEYNLKYNNDKQEKMIDEINNKIFQERNEIKKLRDYSPLQIDDILYIVNNKLIPLTIELQNVNYPIMEIDIIKKGEIKLFQYNKKPIFIRIK